MNKAIVRGIPDTFDAALVMGERPRPEAAKAQKQHADYCAHLSQAGYELIELTADEDYPDCDFVEDTAVVLGPEAVICRPGASSRRGEVGIVSEVLVRNFELRSIVEPGTMDGGDVFIAGDTIYVGLSGRTNQEAVRQLSDIAREIGMGVVPIEVRHVLHLKSAVLPIDDRTLVVTPGTVDETLLSDFVIIPEALEERHQFSALPMQNGTVLVTANAPRTAELVSAGGHTLVAIDVSEIQAADGGLTCLSILY